MMGKNHFSHLSRYVCLQMCLRHQDTEKREVSGSIPLPPGEKTPFQPIQTVANPFYDMLKIFKQVTNYHLTIQGFYWGGRQLPSESRQKCIRNLCFSNQASSVWRSLRVTDWSPSSVWAKPSGDTDWSPGVQLGRAFEAPSWLLEGECSSIQGEHVEDFSLRS